MAEDREGVGEDGAEDGGGKNFTATFMDGISIPLFPSDPSSPWVKVSIVAKDVDMEDGERRERQLALLEESAPGVHDRIMRMVDGAIDGIRSEAVKARRAARAKARGESGEG
ncbi:MAG: hypothetical protein JRN42_08315 [Nitrososphaerota archaeon]|nr:hypothetical protein [Nitrososphaerota archaeon]